MIRPRDFFTTLALGLIVGLAPACSSNSGTGGARPEFAPLALPGPAGAPALPAPKDPPRDLAGVDTAKLSARERNEWWRLVSQLYAPCPDQAVSIGQCVQETRPCSACTPAASLIATKVLSGAASVDIEQAYAVRFGPNVRKVDVADSPTRGPADAPITLVVWSDFQCPACKMAMPILDKVIEKHDGKVRLVHKFYPLKAHPRADSAARAAIAAKNQGKYWQMEAIIFERQDRLTDVDLEEYAKEVGLNLARYREDIRSAKTAEIIARDKAAADAAGLSATPFILINGREFDRSYFQLDIDLNNWIDVELQLVGKGAAEVASPPATTAAPEGKDGAGSSTAR
jgi:protein-disulfide isomerase